MKAMVIRGSARPELEVRDLPDPQPSFGQVRVRVRATAVNRADLLFVLGKYPLPPGAPPGVPGLEFAGEVDALGPGVADLAVGDRVFGLVAGGAYAEHAVVHERTLARIPDGLSFTDAAAVPEAFTTAWDAMVAQARLASGEVVLIHAATSGVGTAAAQLARACGATAIGTGRSAEKLQKARALGLDEALVVSGPSFAPAVLEHTAGRGADVIIDLVGGPYVPEDLACIAPRGRIVVVGLLAGARAEIDLGALLRKRVELRGTMLASRPLEEKILAGTALARHLVPLLARRRIVPVVDQVLPLEHASEAHRRLADGGTVGKIVLEVP